MGVSQNWVTPKTTPKWSKNRKLMEFDCYYVENIPMIWGIWDFQIATETAVNWRNATLLASWPGRYPWWIMHHVNKSPIFCTSTVLFLNNCLSIQIQITSILRKIFVGPLLGTPMLWSHSHVFWTCFFLHLGHGYIYYIIYMYLYT